MPALLDATIDVAGGNVNIHVLMAFAALASVFMGSALEGGLLLAMFSLSHLGMGPVSMIGSIYNLVLWFIPRSSEF